MDTQNDMNLDDQARFFYSPLNQSYTPYKLPHIGSHAFAIFYAHALCKKMGNTCHHAHITLTTFEFVQGSQTWQLRSKL